MLKKVIREPLIQFLFLGAVLVAADNFLLGAPADAGVIRLSVAEQQQLAENFWQRWARLPTEVEQENLVEDYVREEVLYREAVRLGLDTHDTIIRRRLAQKMQFLLETSDPSYHPDDAILRAYLRDNPERFIVPPSISFRHLFFSNDTRRNASKDANAALNSVGSMPEDLVGTIGDRFPFGEQFETASRVELNRAFGPGFADQVLRSSGHVWNGPFESAFGQHLVFVTRRVPARLPPLDSIRQVVQSAYLSERVVLLADERYKAIRERFIVDVEPATVRELRVSVND